jgi:hypothetical protein
MLTEVDIELRPRATVIPERLLEKKELIELRPGPSDIVENEMPITRRRELVP